MLPQYERKVSGPPQTVTLGSAAAIDHPQVWRRASRRPSRVEDSALHHRLRLSRRPNLRPPAPSRHASIILGHDMAEEIGATVGSVVLVTSPQGDSSLRMSQNTSASRRRNLQLRFSITIPPGPLSASPDAQELFGLGDVISVIQFKIDDIYQAAGVAHNSNNPPISSQEATLHGHQLMEQNKPCPRPRLERVVTFITIGLIVFVAALNILISLIMMVMEKTKTSPSSCRWAPRKNKSAASSSPRVLIGVIGTVIGLILGYAISYAGGHYHFIASPPKSIPSTTSLRPRLIDGLIVALVSIGISFIATIYPSWSAARILPAEALRYE